MSQASDYVLFNIQPYETPMKLGIYKAHNYGSPLHFDAPPQESVQISEVKSMTLTLYMEDGSKSTILVPNPTYVEMKTVQTQHSYQSPAPLGPDPVTSLPSEIESLSFTMKPKPDPETGSVYTMKIETMQTPPTD